MSRNNGDKSPDSILKRLHFLRESTLDSVEITMQEVFTARDETLEGISALASGPMDRKQQRAQRRLERNYYKQMTKAALAVAQAKEYIEASDPRLLVESTLGRQVLKAEEVIVLEPEPAQPPSPLPSQEQSLPSPQSFDL